MRSGRRSQVACAEVVDGSGRCVLVTGEAGIGKTRLVGDALAGTRLPVYTGAARLAVAEPYAPIAQILRQCFRRVPDLAEACGPLALVSRAAAARDRGRAPLRMQARRRSSRHCSASSARWRRAARSRSCSTISTGPTRRRCCSCRDWRLRCAMRRCCWSPSRATRCRPTPIACAACERRCAGAASPSSCRCGRSTAATPRGWRPPSRSRNWTTTSSPPCTSARTAFRSTSRSWRRRSPSTGATPARAACHCPTRCSTPCCSAPRRSRWRARNALELAAVVGERCDLVRAPGLSGEEPLAEAVAAGFVVERSPGQLVFRHALVRDAVYHAIPWTRRRSLHALVARSLEDSGASAAERAAHWLGAGEVVRARGALAEAATDSEGVYAYLDAAKLYEQALDLGEGAETRALRAARAPRRLRGAGRRPRRISARAWREVIDGRRGRGEVEQLAEAEHAIGRVLALRGSTERALTAWSAAADAFAPAGGPTTPPARGSPRPSSCSRPATSGLRWPQSRTSSTCSRPARRPSSARARSRSTASCAPSSATRRERSSRCDRPCRKRSSRGIRARPRRPTRPSRSSTRTPASSARRSRPTTSRSTTASRRAVSDDGGRLLGLSLSRAPAAGRVAPQPGALALAARRPGRR